MRPLPTQDLRSNVATWAVPAALVPAVAYRLPHLAPTEEFDPCFAGQELATTYFDTLNLALRKARRGAGQYLTLRLRCYAGNGQAPEVYALSAKTESEKWRQEITERVAQTILTNPLLLAAQLPPNLQARLSQIAGEAPLVQAATVCCRRYAVENDEDRYTLDVGVHTHSGKHLHAAVLEYKSTEPQATPPGSLPALNLPPLKLSKFLWATGV